MKIATNSQMRSPYPLCIRFFTEMKALGIEEVVISPGSRSTPLVLSAHAVGLETKVFLDERSAGFYALGNAKSSGVPCILISTSGTASANYLPAIVEANHAGVPMIVCTADRPPEQRQWGAGQTINQVNLFGSNVRWSYDLPVATEADEMLARNIALRAWERSMATRGPVHLNWPFRKPLEPDIELFVPEATLKPFEITNDSYHAGGRLKELATEYERGVIVVGPNDFPCETLQQIAIFGRIASWPILADPGSQMRGGSIEEGSNVVTTGEILCGSVSFTESLEEAEVIIHVGLTPTSKGYQTWITENPPAKQILIDPGVDWSDPSHQIAEVYQGNPFGAFSDTEKQIRSTSNWLEKWKEADTLANSVVKDLIGSGDTNEIATIHAVRMGVPEGATIVLSNSMVIRDAELAFLNTGTSFRTISNRGANGIDGLVSTSTGVAHGTSRKVVAIIWDIAATHDIGGFLAASRLQTDLTVVVFDNGGGGIFSLLPISESIERETFERFYMTPPNGQLPEMLIAAGISVETPTSLKELTQQVQSSLADGGLKVIWYQTDSTATADGFKAIRENFNTQFAR